MKLVVLFSVLFLAFSCGVHRKTSKDQVVVESTESSLQLNYGEVLGTVHMNNSGCPLTIELIEDNAAVIAYPINLEEEYQKEGRGVIITYAVSRAMQPEGCGAQKVISILTIRGL